MDQSAPPADLDQVFAQPFTPRFYEIDGQGVMFNMWYLAYVDEAVTGFFVHRGLPYSRWPDLGFDVRVAHAELDWKEGIEGGERSEVLISTARVGGRSFTLDFAFRRDGRLTCTGCVVYVTVSTGDSAVIPLPSSLIEALGPIVPLR
ncbi:acyl-CoA thioesterase [Nonomuraea rhodomycinica]|uniref:Acyl-CoA thioesterase n=1 Tax=Nonomuraea rhodomycinica TaxID=1712872 RepID=A0A7Y6IMW0_9ACTN|nr:thioesterase family protein [Nonomuraea rhodomycinica]NUW40866.1 acyl-CoA thioesterase [Nonomuraea rhodomycinica]